MAKPGKAKEVQSIIRTQNDKKYKAILENAEKTVSKYTAVLARATKQDPEVVNAEISAIYLENLRRADDSVMFMKESLANLMLKKQTSDYVEEKRLESALEAAEAAGDEEQVAKIEAEMVERLGISKFDLEIHNTIMNTVKTIEKSEHRSPANSASRHLDDGIVFDVEES